MPKAIKVLILTYYWPPAGGPGVQRWVKFAKYLEEFGVIPTIVCPKNPNYPVYDPILSKELPQHLNVHEVPIFEPARILSRLLPQQSKSISRGMVNTQNPGLLERLLMSIRGHFFIPDTRQLWIRPAVKYLEHLLEQNSEIDLIITTGPPHSVHLIGQKIQQSRGIKWMADFRDPWTEIYYHKALNLMGWAQRRHLKLEQGVLEAADRIITTSSITAESFQCRTPQPVSVITNGYDAHDFGTVTHSDEKSKGKFRIVHVGTLMEPRNPEVLWQALSRLLHQHRGEELDSFGDDLEIHLTGNVASGVVESIQKLGLGNKLVLVPNCSHDQAIQTMANGQLLLLSERDEEDARHIIPAKLFEYLALSAPILALGPARGSIEPIVRNARAGGYFVQGDLQGVERYLISTYKAFKEGQVFVDREQCQVYERKNLTQQLAELIKTMTATQ